MGTTAPATPPTLSSGPGPLPRLADRLLPQFIALSSGHGRCRATISPVVTLHSGTPFSISSGTDTTLIGGTSRANLVGNPNLDPHRSRNQVIAEWFNTAAFGVPAPYDGTSGRDILNGPGFKGVDMAISRDFKLH